MCRGVAVGVGKKVLKVGNRHRVLTIVLNVGAGGGRSGRGKGEAAWGLVGSQSEPGLGPRWELESGPLWELGSEPVVGSWVGA